MKKSLLVVAMGILVSMMMSSCIIITPGGGDDTNAVSTNGYLKIVNTTEESWINNLYSTTETSVTVSNTWSTDLITTAITNGGDELVLEMAPGTYNLKMEITNFMYEELNEDAAEGMHYVVYQTAITVTNGETNTFTLKPAILEITNNSGATLTFMYTSFSADPAGDGYFDLLNLVAEDNTLASADTIADGGVWNTFSGDADADWEFVTGSYEFVTVIDGSVETNLDSFIVDVPAPGTNIMVFEIGSFIQN